MTAALESIQTIGSTTARVFTPPKHEVLTPETSWGYDCIDFLENIMKWKLLPWQRWLYVHALEKDDKGGFRFKTVIVLVARQNGKSQWLRGVGLWRLFMDRFGRQGPDCPAARLAIIACQNLDYAESMLKQVVDEVRDHPLLSKELVNHRECLAVDTPILTTDGWKTMSTLVVGDQVFHPDGHPIDVLEVHPEHVGRDCYRVETTDGRSVIADANHRWLVQDSHHDPSKSWVEMTTAQILQKGVDNCPGRYRWRLPDQKAIISKSVDLPIDPWLLGAWLGDGYCKGAELAVGDKDLEEMTGLISRTADIVSVRRDSRGRSSVVRFSTGVIRDGFEARCRRLGIWGNKRIPDAYLADGTEQRLALLQGLMDTDGGISKAGQVEFCTMLPQLAEQVVYLCRSLGFRATVRTGRASLNGKDYGIKYRICFTPHQEQGNPFALTRKAALVRKVASKHNPLKIKAITPVESVPVNCISVNSDDETFLAGTALMPTMNTNGKHRMILTNRRYWRAATANRKGARSLSVDLAELDELREQTNWDAWNAIVPTTTARPYSQVVAASNAGDMRSEVLRSLRDAATRRIRTGETEHTQVGLFEWSVPMDVDPKDPSYWYMANPAMGMLNDFTIDDLRGFLEAMEYKNLPGFQTEHLCQWVDALEPGILPAEHWSDTMDPTSARRPDAPVYACLDVNYQRTAAYIAIAARRPDGKIHIELVAAGRGTDWVTPWLAGNDAAGVPRRKKFAAVVVQKTGAPSASLIPELEEAKIPLIEWVGPEIQRGCGEFFDKLVEHAIFHRPAVTLDRAAASTVARTIGDAWVFDRRNSPVDASPIIACAGAVWAESYKPDVKVPNIWAWPDEDEISEWEKEAEDEEGW